LVDATTEYDPRTGLPVSSGLALPGRVRELVAYAPEVPLGPGERWTAELARPRRLTNVLGGVTRAEYAGRTIRTTDPRGGVTVEVYGLDGLVRSVTDPATAAGTAETTYEYDEHEALRVTTDALGFEYLVERDRFGRVIEAHHPDSGYDEVEYDAWGLPAFVVHRPTGIRYTADIDELGRTTEVVARRGTTEQRNVWEYDGALNGIGLLHRSTSSDGVVETLGYESGGLLRERTVAVDGRSYRTRIRQRGRDGRIERLDVPLGGSSSAVRSIGYQYDNPGFLRAVEPYGSATPWWERVDIAADGQTRLERFHATSVTTDHDPATGMVREVAFQAGSNLLGRYGYGYDTEGRLSWREQRNWTGSPATLRRERFTYDARGQLENVRLETSGGSLLQARSYTYDVLGNLQTAVRPAGTRQYVRDPAYPHRTDRTTGHDPRDLTYDERGQVTSSGTATVAYDLFGRPTSITEPVSRGSRQFAYDAAGNLVRTSSSRGIAYRPDAVTEEVVGASSYVLHRIGGENLSGSLVRSGTSTTDRMMSQVVVEPASAAITLDGTTVVENYSFDEWGVPRGADWMSTSVSSIGGTAGLVGFAGHLHAGVDALLTRFQHMGARLYDRDLGLMTSPDPITNPRRALDLNPFAYAWNDPLNVLDPTGMNEEPEYGAVAVVDRGGYPYLVGSPGSLASTLGWAESLIESACGGAALCQFDGFGVGRQFTPRAFTPLSSGAPTGRSRPPARPQPARSRPDASGRPQQPATSLVESNPPARRVQQSVWSDIFTFADGVASGLNPFDDHRAGPVENGDPDVWNVGRAFGSGAGLIGDALLIFQGGQMVGSGAALTVAGQIEVGVPAMAVGSAAVGAGTIMAPRHAQQFGASITQMSRPRAQASGPRASTPFPRSSLRGVSTRWLRRNKPRGWREVPTARNEGWIWVDENGIERLRFMRPNGANPAASQWSRQSNGYFRWTNESGQFLDVDGNVVPPNHPAFQELTHIPYEGP
jgi:RHS repeat-associated protein